MKLTVLFLLLFAGNVVAQNGNPYFLSNPTLTPDGETVIFSYEGDLWKAAVKDGNATRITAMQGYETSPRVSPDGKWIAFSGRQYGNADVFVMPINGGEIQQLTFHSSGDEVTSWSWDSKFIYFNSGRNGQISGFKVAKEGGTPSKVFADYFFLYDHNLIEHPTTGEIFFNDTWESNNQVQRKRYKGAFNPDIQSYNPKSKQYKKYTNWEGKDFAATIDRKGNVYFISDESNGEYNLYTLVKDNKKALTKFSSSIKTPQVNANGGKVIYEKDYQLWIYDAATDKESKLAIAISRNNILPKEKDFDVKGNITAFDVSPDGKKIAFTARGELFVSDAEGKFIQEVDRHTVERAAEVKWLSDNKTILYTQTFNGYTNLYTIVAGTTSTPKQITNDQRNNRSLVFNKAKTKAVYLSGRNEVHLLDLKTMSDKLIVKDEIWGFQNSNPGFSPNDEYVIFTVYRDFEQDILVYHINDNKTTNLTKTGISETDPIWSPDGQSIYFTSQRLKPSYPFGTESAHVYKIALEKKDDPFKMDKFNELFTEEKKDTTQKKKTATDSIAKNSIVIDQNGLMKRIEQISPDFGQQFLIQVVQKGDKTTVLYASNHAEGQYGLYKTILEPFEANKTERIAGAIGGGFDWVQSGDKYFLLINGTIHKLNLDANKADPINMSFVYRRNLAGEFEQIFDEAWAQMQENYYDEHFHGLDWKKTKAYYRQFLPYLNNRADLRILLNDMLGELNSSHQGFSTFGADETIALQNRTMETGIVFDNEQPFRVKYIVKRSPADKKGINLQPGDELIQVNQELVNPAIDRSFYFTKPSLDKEIKLTFRRAGQNIEIKLHPTASMAASFYEEWIDRNQQVVDEKSKGKIAYGYMKNMGTEELQNFIIDMTQELQNKDALILDLRYNTGGNVHDEVLNFLSQRSYLQWKYREGAITRQPNFSPSDKPIVLLINEQSLSDAEMTSQGFKALKLGKIIGNETYRWIIFTSGVGLVDGSFVRLPAWGCYSLDGKDLEKTGVQPDILVINTFEDKINGKDPQLEKAIEEILKQIK